MGGGKDSDNAPPDSDMMQMSMYPKLKEPFNALIKQFENYYTDPSNMPGYGPETVAPWNPAQWMAYEGGMGTALGGIPGAAGFSDWLGGQVGQKAGNLPGNRLFNLMSGGAYRNPAQNRADQILRRSLGPGGGAVGIDTLEDFARGQYVGKNPYLDAMYKRGTESMSDVFRESTMPGIENLITMSGRGGGGGLEEALKGRAQGELGQDLEGFATNLYGQAYEGDMGRMLGAAQALPGAEATDIGTSLNANQQLAQLWQQGLENRVTGAKGANDLIQQAFARNMAAGQAMPGAFQTQMAPWQAMNQMGGAAQAQRERELQEQQGIYRWENQAPANFMNQYLQAMGGLAGIPNMQGAANYATQQMQQPSPFERTLGNISGVLGLGSRIGGMMSGVPMPWGGGGGGGYAASPALPGNQWW